jgi:hypothetical protein
MDLVDLLAPLAARALGAMVVDLLKAAIELMECPLIALHITSGLSASLSPELMMRTPYKVARLALVSLAAMSHHGSNKGDLMHAGQARSCRRPRQGD